MSKPDNRSTDPRTVAIHEGVYKDSAFNSVTTPIYPSSTFGFERVGVTKGYDYTRSGNPTRAALQENLAALEGGTAAWATCTGMSAITSVAMLFKSGDHLLAGNDIYSGTIRLLEAVLPGLGIITSFVPMGDPDEVRKAIRPNTRGMIIETPSNPILNLVDLAAMTAIAREHEILTVVDNTFMSPCFQKPLAFGADVVVHSTTKYLNGHSDVVGGAIVVKEARLGERIGYLVNALGTACSPFDAWLVLRGVKTLAYRMEAHQANALAIAHWLQKHPRVKKVYYPGLVTHPGHQLARKQMRGFGGMVSFDLDLDQLTPDELFARLRYFTLAESLGGVESLVEQPWTMSHASIGEDRRRAAGISPATIRLSIGIEGVDDLIADLDRGLAPASR